VIDALVEVIPGVIIVGLLLILFAVSAGKAIAAMEEEVPVGGRATSSVSRASRSETSWRGSPINGTGSERSARSSGEATLPGLSTPGRSVEGLSLHVLRSGPDNAAARAVAVPARSQHHLARVEEFRDGTVRAHCSCGRAVSHTLPSHIAAEAWVAVHAAIEDRLAAFGEAR